MPDPQTICISILISVFWFLNVNLSDSLILPVSQIQTQQVMTSLIRLHIIFNTDLTYLCAHYVVEFDKNLALMAGLIRFNDDL